MSKKVEAKFAPNMKFAGHKSNSSWVGRTFLKFAHEVKICLMVVTS